MFEIACAADQVANVYAQFRKDHSEAEWRRIEWLPSGHLLVPDDLVAAVQACDLAKAPVPQTVALWQARAALRMAGLFAQIDTYVQAHMNDQPALYEAWEYGNQVSRSGAFVAALAGPELGLSDVQVDDLFRAAAAIQG